LLRTFRVQMPLFGRTAILKVPVNEAFEGDSYVRRMKQWMELPYHPRIVRPLFWKVIAESKPLVFIEDLPFCTTLEGKPMLLMGRPRA